MGEYDDHHTPHLIIEYMGEESPHVGGALSLMLMNNALPVHTAAHAEQIKLPNLPASTDIHFDPIKAGYKPLNKGWVQLGNTNNSELFGSKSNPPLFKNINIQDIREVRSIAPVKELNINAIRAISKNELPILYVILEDGRLILIHETGNMQTQFGVGRQVSIKHGEVTHVTKIHDQIKNTAKPNWKLAAAAGEVWVENGKIVKITRDSGGFLPDGPHLNNLVEHVFVKHGFFETRGTFSYEVPNWFNANKPHIYNSQQVRASKVASKIFVPEELFRPVTYNEFQELRYSQQPNPFKRLFHIPIPSSQVVVNKELGAQLARKEFWQLRHISVNPANIARNPTLQAVGNFCKPIAPFTPGIAYGAAFGIEVYREHKANPNGRYVHDALHKFAIDTACFAPVFALLKGYALPVILTANMPDLTEPAKEAWTNSYKFNPTTAGEFLWQEDIDERAYELSFANGMRSLTRTLLSPFSKASAEMKQDLVDRGVIAGIKSPLCPNAMAEFKANLDAQKPNSYLYQELDFKSYVPPGLLVATNVPTVSWADLAPKKIIGDMTVPVMPQPIYPAPTKPFHYNPVPGSNNNSQFKFDPSISGVNADYNLGAIGAGVVSVGLGMPVVAIVAAVYTFAEKSFYKKGRAYYEDVKKQTAKASKKMGEFNSRLNELKTMSPPKNATEIDERAKQLRSLLPLLKQAKDEYKELSDLTDVKHRHKTRSNFWGWHTLSDSEYDLVKNIHYDSDKIVGDEKRRTGSYSTKDSIHNTIGELETASPKQRVVDHVLAETQQQNQVFQTTMQKALADCKDNKISDAELFKTLSEFTSKSDQMTSNDFSAAQEKLKNDASYLANVKTNSEVVTERKTKAIELAATTLYNKYFCTVDKNGFAVVDANTAIKLLEELHKYQAHPTVATVTAQMKTTITTGFENRANQIILDMNENKRSLQACLSDVKALQAESKVYESKKEFTTNLLKPLEDLLAVAKSKTIEMYGALVEANKISEAETLLSASLMDQADRENLKNATARFQEEKRQQRIQHGIELANQTLRAGSYALSIFAELRRSPQQCSAPSIPTATMQRAHYSIWQAPAARDQHGADPLNLKKEEPVRVSKQVRL